MLSNVVIDLVGNFSLLFAWIGEKPNNVYWTLIGEDPISGQPFILSGGPADTFARAASEAWKCIASGDWFDVRAAIEGLPPVSTIWRRAFGPNFSHVVSFVETGKGEIPGVALIRYHTRAEHRLGHFNQA